jgi:transposase
MRGGRPFSEQEAAMMGNKARLFAPQRSVTLNDLVPPDHFYRHLDRSLDLSFVRDLVRDCYAPLGRPSIDPIVFFKLHLVKFFEGIRSARQLELVAADRISVRWYLGYDLDQPLPDHSSLTRIRDRYGIEVFRQFFETIVARCQAAGLVVGQALYADGTLVDANADRDAMVPRFAVEAYLQQLFGETEPSSQAPDPAATAAEATALHQVERLRRLVRARQRKPHLDDPVLRGHFPPTLPPEPTPPPAEPTATLPDPPSSPAPAANDSAVPAATPESEHPPELRSELSPAAHAELAAHNQQRHDWFALSGAPDRQIQRGAYQRVSNFWVSTTDPDAALMREPGQGVRLRYRTHYLVDGGPARIILQVLVTPADVKENSVFLDLLWRACFRWQLRPKSVSGDTTYGTLESIKAVEDAGIRAYLPLTDREPAPPRIGKQAFRFDPSANQYVCPQGAVLSHRYDSEAAQMREYQAEAAVCNACPLKQQCTSSLDGRIIRRSFDEAYLERVRAYHQSAEYQKVYRKRKVVVEPLFGEAQAWHGLRRFGVRGLPKVNGEAVLIAAGQNLKRLLAALGWGRRPLPCGATGVYVVPVATEAAGAGSVAAVRAARSPPRAGAACEPGPSR